MAEWLKALAWKASGVSNGSQGFKSLFLCQFLWYRGGMVYTQR
jgi:hypothetical protein